MHQRGQQRPLILSPSRASATPSPRRSPGTLLAVIGLLGCGVIGAGIGCGDKDTTDVTPPQGGSGGSAGSAGRGGSAGTAGTAGRGGSAGTAGTAGTGGTGELPDAGEVADATAPTDAGPDSGDGGNGGPPGPDPVKLARAEAICQFEEDVADCDPPPDSCVQGFLDAQEGPPGMSPNCSDEIIDFYQCLVDQGLDAFICREGVVDHRYDLLAEDSPCAAEEADWLNAQGNVCAD